MDTTNNISHYGDTVLATYTFDDNQQITERLFAEDITYVILDKKTIMRTDRNLEHIQLVYTSDKTIESIAVERDVVYISYPDKSFYLYHINSKTLHFMYQNEKSTGGIPYSNYKVYTNIYTDYAYSFIVSNKKMPVMSREETQNRFLYDTRTTELTFVPLDYSSR